MASVDFKSLRSLISMQQVLDLVGFESVVFQGDQVRGRCPLHEPHAPRSRSFSANLHKNAFRCFRCGVAGNQLDLWAKFTKQSLHAAALDLCGRLNIPYRLVTHDRATKRQRRGTRKAALLDGFMLGSGFRRPLLHIPYSILPACSRPKPRI